MTSFDSRMPAPDPSLTCPDCKKEIDPAMCWCGDSMNHHSVSAGHSPVPMGCACWNTNNVSLQLQLLGGDKHGVQPKGMALAPCPKTIPD